MPSVSSGGCCLSFSLAFRLPFAIELPWVDALEVTDGAERVFRSSTPSSMSSCFGRLFLALTLAEDIVERDEVV